MLKWSIWMQLTCVHVYAWSFKCSGNKRMCRVNKKALNGIIMLIEITQGPVKMISSQILPHVSYWQNKDKKKYLKNYMTRKGLVRLTKYACWFLM